MERRLQSVSSSPTLPFTEAVLSTENYLHFGTLNFPKFYKRLVDVHDSFKKRLMCERVIRVGRERHTDDENRLPSHANHLVTATFATGQDCKWLIDLYLFSDSNQNSDETWVGIYLFLLQSRMKPAEVKFLFSLQHKSGWIYNVGQTAFEQHGQLWGCKTYIPSYVLLSLDGGFIRGHGLLLMDFKISVQEYDEYSSSTPSPLITSEENIRDNDDQILDLQHRNCDVTLRIGNVKIQAHREKLVEGCRLFQEVIKQIQGSVVEIVGVGICITVEMLHFLYTSLSPEIRELAGGLLLSKGNNEALTALRVKAEATLSMNILTNQNVADYLIISHYLKASNLMLACKQLICDHRNSDHVNGWMHLFHRHEFKDVGDVIGERLNIVNGNKRREDFNRRPSWSNNNYNNNNRIYR